MLPEKGARLSSHWKYQSPGIGYRVLRKPGDLAYIVHAKRGTLISSEGSEFGNSAFLPTAFPSGPPVSGSINPFCEAPATHPRSFTHQGKLLLVPGSAPKSCTMPCSHLNACCTAQLGLEQLGKYGSGIGVSAQPTTVPALMMTPGSKNSRMLSGLPSVPRSTNLYRA